MGRNHEIAVIPGDGIGQEVVPSAISCVDALGEHFDFQVRWRHVDWGSDHMRRTGRMMPSDGLDSIRDTDAILLGAVGDPDIPDIETLWGLLIPIRRTFDQYVNLRPVRSLPGVPSPLAADPPIDVVIVRENVEGEYSDVGGRFGRGTPTEFALQDAIFTRANIERLGRYAVALAAQRGGGLVSATKSNGIIHTMPFWDEVITEACRDAPGVTLRSVLIDALAARLVLAPQEFDVIVASNLFGDILSDLAAALTGSIGVAASGNINPERRFPSMFEPVHGSAPDIAGQGVANPLGAIGSSVLMLEHLGEREAATILDNARDDALRAGVRTRDVGGTASTQQFTAAVIESIGIIVSQRVSISTQ